MRILLTTDDGIVAPGLEALRRAARAFGEIFVFAPLHAHSGCSHRLTTGKTIHVAKRGPREYAVDGTPGDCVRLGLHHAACDWVLAGVNEGGNLGVDVFYSGTVAAAREAAIHGAPAAAFSHYVKRGRPRDWGQAEQWTSLVFSRIKDLEHAPGTFWSVNFPHLAPGDEAPRIVCCPLDVNPLPLVYDREEGGYREAGAYDERPRTRGADVEVCFSGNIAVTRLSTRHGSWDEGALAAL